jgi:hypothetical protein
MLCLPPCPSSKPPSATKLAFSGTWASCNNQKSVALSRLPCTRAAAKQYKSTVQRNQFSKGSSDTKTLGAMAGCQRRALVRLRKSSNWDQSDRYEGVLVAQPSSTHKAKEESHAQKPKKPKKPAVLSRCKIMTRKGCMEPKPCLNPIC